jgi:segregation and condensation protein B
MLLDTPEGWRLVTKPEFWTYVERLREPQRIRLSKPALETLAIVAYRQPVTRAEIDSIRGVDCSGTLQTLVDRYLVTAVGRKESPGRPVLYGTTSEFLEHFGLKSLEELPGLPEAALETMAAIEARAETDGQVGDIDRPSRDMTESDAVRDAEQQGAV